MNAPAPALAPAREHADERLQRARAALSAAEQAAARWGGKIDRTALRAVPSAPREPSRTAPGSAPASTATGERYAVPDALVPLFPGGALRAGGSVAVTGSAASSLLLALAAAATGDGAWCAIAGMGDLGLRCALDAGLAPERLALAPLAEHEQRPAVLSALVDGVGVLVLGPDLELAPSLWRTLCDRARTRDALVLAAAPPGRADLHLETASAGWTGLSTGSGRLRRRRVHVRSHGRGIAGHRELEALLPQVGELIATVPGRADTAREQTPDASAVPAPLHLQAVRRAG